MATTYDSDAFSILSLLSVSLTRSGSLLQDVDHIVIEIVDGYIWFDFAPGGNAGVNDNANINMASNTAVNDNNWHVFFGERYACYVSAATVGLGCDCCRL